MEDFTQSAAERLEAERRAGLWGRHRANQQLYRLPADLESGVFDLERAAVATTCSWCNTTNTLRDRYCIQCGHEAHIASSDCECTRCTVVREVGTTILEEGMKWERVDIPPDDAQFLETHELREAHVASSDCECARCAAVREE